MSTPKTSNKARMAAKRQAVDTDPIMAIDTPQTPAPSAPPADEPKGPKWEDAHRRYTFHLPNDLVAEAKSAAADNGLSTSALVAQAIRAEVYRLR